MRLLLLFSLIFLCSCATKYLLPGNRFITPESQGEAFRGQIELQRTTANELKMDTSNGTVDDGVKYSESNRMGFLFSNSFFDKLDLIWSHTGGGNSMIGGKFQVMGGSRVSGSTGHKLSLAALFGSNEHETDDRSVEFELGGKEFLVLYGYRFMPELLVYSSLSKANYNFEGKIKKGDASIVGMKPKIGSDILSLSGGVEGSINSIFAKLEFTYQSLDTEHTKKRTQFITGFSLGVGW